jgi:hypothetical protein
MKRKAPRTGGAALLTAGEPAFHPRVLAVARVGAHLVVVHNTVRRLELDPLNFAEEKGSRRR